MNRISKLSSTIALCLLGLHGVVAKPNVLFIAIDDLKPVLGCYGDNVAITPNMDALAKGGTVFLNSHCQWPVCGPSRASLMTSLRPEAVGVMDLKTDMRAKNPDVVTLPQHFKNHGYTTAGVGKIYDPRCVDHKFVCDAPSWSIPFAKLPYHKLEHKQVKKVFLAPNLPDEKLFDGAIARIGVDLMKKMAKEGKPFFLAVGFKKPHLPFIAPKKYWDLYRREQFALAKHRGGIKNDSGYLLHNSFEFRGYEGVPAKGPIPDALQRESLHAYYACVSYIDAQIGLLLGALKELGLDGRTDIVLWGDHGFHLGDHGMWGKHSLLEHATRSPLIFRPHSGRAVPRSKAPVEFTDIFPTLCQLAGLPIPQGLNGRSQLPVIRGERKQVREGALTVFKSKGVMGYSYRTVRHRYTEWINKYGQRLQRDLFDYQTDSAETTNRSRTPLEQKLMKELAARLRKDGQGCELLFRNNKNKSSK